MMRNEEGPNKLESSFNASGIDRAVWW